jgi:hypothetical protein
MTSASVTVAARLSLRQRWTLMVGTIVIVVTAVAISVFQRVAPDMRLKADGFAQVGTVQGYDVWAKVNDDRIDVRIPDHNGGDLCPTSGSFTTAFIPLCADSSPGVSVFVAVAPPSSPATIVTTAGSEVPATLVQAPGWKYALAIRIANDESLLGASLKSRSSSD